MIQNTLRPASVAETRTGYRRYLLGLLLVVSIIAYSDRLILGFLVDSIKHDLDLSDTEMGLLTGFAFSAFYALMGLPIGRAIDVFPRNIVLAACITAWSLCTMLCGAAVGGLSLFLVRCGIGAGEAGMNPSAVSLIADYFPREHVVRALAWYSVGVVGGGGAAILLGGQLIAYLHGLGPISILMLHNIAVWRVVFVILGIPGLLAALLVLVTVREKRDTSLVSAAPAVRVPMREIVGFVWEDRAVFGPLLGGLIAFGFYNYAVLGWYPVMFARNYHVGAAAISIFYGLAYLASGVSGVLLSSPLVRLLDRRGFSDAIVIALAGASAAAVLPAVAGPLMPGFHASVACFFVSMLMSSVITSMAFSALVMITAPNRRGTAVAVYVMLMNLTGASLGNVLVGVLSDYVFGPVHLARSISLIALIAVPISTLCFLKVRPAYRATRAQREREQSL